MLTVHTDDIQAIFTSQPLLQPPAEFPRPGTMDDEADTEDQEDAS